MWGTVQRMGDVAAELSMRIDAAGGYKEAARLLRDEVRRRAAADPNEAALLPVRQAAWRVGLCAVRAYRAEVRKAQAADGGGEAAPARARQLPGAAPRCDRTIDMTLEAPRDTGEAR